MAIEVEICACVCRAAEDADRVQDPGIPQAFWRFSGGASAPSFGFVARRRRVRDRARETVGGSQMWYWVREASREDEARCARS